MAGTIIPRPRCAVRVVAKAVRNSQHAIQRKQTRQTFRLLRIDLLQRTGQAPCAPNAFCRQRRRAHGLGGRVMQKTAKRLAAKILVIARVQDEGMPGVVRHLRRHRDKTSTCLGTQDEIIAQTIEHPLFLRRIELRPYITEFHAHRLRKRMRPDQVQLALQGPLAPTTVRNPGHCSE